MADEQTGDFFAEMDQMAPPPPVPTEQPPPAGDGFDDDFMMDFASTPAAAPPAPPANYIGEVEDASDEDEPVSANDAEPIILGDPSQYSQPPEFDAPAPMDYAAPTDFAAPMDFAAPTDYDAPAPTDYAAPIILGAPPAVVEDDIPPPVQEPEEPSPMAKWNEQWQVTLKERKDAENALKAEMVNAARAETDKFLEERSVKLASRQTTNRTSEEDKLKAMQEDLESDNSWQRVVKLVELTQDSVEKSAEVKRMRDLLILLKNDKERAELLS